MGLETATYIADLVTTNPTSPTQEPGRRSPAPAEDHPAGHLRASPGPVVSAPKRKARTVNDYVLTVAGASRLRTA